MHDIMRVTEDSTIELTGITNVSKHTNNRQEDADASPQQQMQYQTSTAKSARRNR